jgi:hypothetical protein
VNVIVIVIVMTISFHLVQQRDAFDTKDANFLLAATGQNALENA